MTDTITKGYIYQEDIDSWGGDDAVTTANRKTSTGGVQALTKFGASQLKFKDILIYSGRFGNDKFVLTEAEMIAANAAGNNIILGADITLTSNFSPTCPVFRANGYTIDLDTYDIDMSGVGEFRGTEGCFNESSTGAVSGMAGRVVNPLWWIQGGFSSSTDYTDEIQAAMDSGAAVVLITKMFCHTFNEINDYQTVQGLGVGTGFKQVDGIEYYNSVTGSTGSYGLSSKTQCNWVCVKDLEYDGNASASLNYADDFDDIFESTDLNTGYQWTASGSGTNEYYLEASGGGDPTPAIHDGISDDGTALTYNPESAGSLGAGEWCMDDNDSLGFNTLYVRLSDGTDPDSSVMLGWDSVQGNIDQSNIAFVQLARVGAYNAPINTIVENVYSHDATRNCFIFHGALQTAHVTNCIGKNAVIDHILYADSVKELNITNFDAQGYAHNGMFITSGANVDGITVRNLAENPIVNATYGLDYQTNLIFQDRKDKRGSNYTNINVLGDLSTITDIEVPRIFDITMDGGKYKNINITDEADADYQVNIFEIGTSGDIIGGSIHGVFCQDMPDQARFIKFDAQSFEHLIYGVQVSNWTFNFRDDAVQKTNALIEIYAATMKFCSIKDGHIHCEVTDQGGAGYFLQEMAQSSIESILIENITTESTDATLEPWQLSGNGIIDVRDCNFRSTIPSPGNNQDYATVENTWFSSTYARTEYVFTIADDAAVSFTPKNLSAIVMVLCNKFEAGGMVYLQARATSKSELIHGTDLEVTTGALTGTDGSDTKATISPHSDGKIYLENRLGASRVFRVKFLHEYSL